MAKVNFNLQKKVVVDKCEVVLTLSLEEAIALAILTASVGGNNKEHTTIREYTDQIYNDLNGNLLGHAYHPGLVHASVSEDNCSAGALGVEWIKQKAADLLKEKLFKE